MSPSLITFINILILLSLAIGAPTIAVGTIALFKIKISTNVRTYLYAFTAGLVVILGTVGFIAEAINHSKEYFSGDCKKGLKLNWGRDLNNSQVSDIRMWPMHLEGLEAFLLGSNEFTWTNFSLNFIHFSQQQLKEH